MDFNGYNNVYSTINDATNYYYKLSYIQPTKGEIMMKSLIKISAMLLIMGFVFADGAYEILVSVADLASNTIQRRINFIYDTQKPKLVSIVPLVFVTFYYFLQ